MKIPKTHCGPHKIPSQATGRLMPLVQAVKVIYNSYLCCT